MTTDELDKYRIESIEKRLDGISKKLDVIHAEIPLMRDTRKLVFKTQCITLSVVLTAFAGSILM